MSQLDPALTALERAAGALDEAALETVIGAIMDGHADEAAIQRFLIASRPIMAHARALTICAGALRARMVAISAPEGAMDVCGTGGDGAHTLNISTAVGFVVAGAGVPVAKHGNRAMSSKSGAGDVLEALGVRLTGDVATLERALADAKIAFLFAQHHHPAMRHVAAARKAYGQRTIFNLLGPLANPARVKRQLVGVFDAVYAAPMRDALAALGAARASVVHGHGGLDEIAISGATLVCDLPGDGGAWMRPQAFGLAGPIASPTITGAGAGENAAALRLLLSDPEKANQDYRAIVMVNAVAALIVAGFSTQDAIAAADSSLKSGRALAALDALIAITRDAP